MFLIDEPTAAAFSLEQEEMDAAMFETVGMSRQNFVIAKSYPFNPGNDYVAEAFATKKEMEEIKKAAEENPDLSAKELAKKLNISVDTVNTVIKSTKITLMYSYEPKPGLKPIIETTRPFCKKLIQLDRLYTRQEIEDISRKVGYSVWDRRGGWWGDSYSCRHQWVANIVLKRN